MVEEESLHGGSSWTAAEAVVLKGHEAAICTLSHSPDGQRLLTSSYDGTAKVWVAGDRAVPRDPPGPRRPDPLRGLQPRRIPRRDREPRLDRSGLGGLDGAVPRDAARPHGRTLPREVQP